VIDASEASMKRDFPTEAPAGLLWHYTGFDACKSILERGTMYASNLEFMNDTEEFNYALRLIRSAFAQPDRVPLDVGLPPMTPAQMYSQMHPYITHWLDGGIFVTCFSTKADDLSQWRAYANALPGFAIGFDPESLEARLKELHFTFEKCIYEREEQESIIQNGIDKALAETKAARFDPPNPGGKIVAFNSACARLSWSSFIQYAVRFKAQAFADESEYRAIKIGGGGTIASPDPAKPIYRQYRQSHSLVVPYIEWTLRDTDTHISPVKAVIVGPGPHKAEVAAAVQQMGGGTIKISVSNIAYRNW
jgi:hypothetical protein